MRWRHSIAQPVFWVLVGFAALLIVGMALMIQVSLQNGLQYYVQRVELKRLDPVAGVLEQRYAEQGNWDFLQHGQPLAPFSVLMRGASPDATDQLGMPESQQVISAQTQAATTPQHIRSAQQGQWEVVEESTLTSPSTVTPRHDTWQGQREQYSPPHSRDILSLGQRVALFDLKQQYVAGDPDALFLPHRELYQGTGATRQVVGYLGVAAITDQLDLSQQQYLDAQQRHLWWIAAISLLLAAVLAGAIGWYVRRPVQAMASGARQLADGDLSVRLAVQRRDELGELATEFNRMASQLEAYEQARRQWVADTSHELRTPITILSAQLEAMSDGIMPINAERLAVLSNTVSGMNRLVGDLHQLASADAGVQDYETQPIPVVAWLAALSDAFAARLAQQQLHSQWDWSAVEGVVIYADRLRLNQVFSNLLTNSCRYTHVGGQVRVQAALHDQQLILMLEDSAPAMDAAQLPYLFDRFYRADASRSRQHGGSGLGLAICQTIVSAHGGTIRAEASDLGGLKIIITLPLRAVFCTQE
jgi:two-component system, OmpR family, sensor histidine kinase BaeS